MGPKPERLAGMLERLRVFSRLIERPGQNVGGPDALGTDFIGGASLGERHLRIEIMIRLVESHFEIGVDPIRSVQLVNRADQIILVLRFDTPAGGAVDVAECCDILNDRLTGRHISVQLDGLVVVSPGGGEASIPGDCVHVLRKCVKR